MNHTGRAPKGTVLAGAILAGLALGVAGIYLPGLHSALLLDDYQNLQSLDALGESAGWGDLLAYAMTDVSGPLGRPVSLLTFAVQHGAWPDNPAAFKAANLSLHLATGGLLFVFFILAGELAGLTRKGALAAALGASALWLLAPLHVSTVLYTVQRMTILSAFFSVASMVAWLHGRAMLAAKRSGGWVWVSLGLGIGGALAVFSKETGVMLPLFLLVLDGTLLRKLPAPAGWRVWKAIFLWGPLLAMAGVFAVRFSDWVAPGYALRDFTLGERMLTEPRVLMDYLRMALLPTPNGLGLFHDDYGVSRGLSEPGSTLPALFFITGLAFAGWKMRRRWPVFSFGVLWFLGGHLLESTFLPLELYFEHRNYLPLAGLYFAFALLGEKAWERVQTPRFRRGVAVTGVLWLMMFGWITWNECRLWGNPLLQAEVWHKHHPASIRARERMGSVWAIAGEYQRAADVFAQMARTDYPAAYMLWWQVGCYDAAVSLPPVSEVVSAFAKATYSNSPLAALEQVVLLKEQGECRRISAGQIGPAIAALLGNPRFSIRKDRLFGLLGRWHAAERQFWAARQALEQAFALNPNPDTALLMARIALAEGRADLARGYLSKGVKLVDRMPFPGSYPLEFAELGRLAGAGY